MVSHFALLLLHGLDFLHREIEKMKAKKTMLEYCKYVLQRVSFNPGLLRKEYRKSILWLQPGEVAQLKQWIRKNKAQLN